MLWEQAGGGSLLGEDQSGGQASEDDPGEGEGAKHGCFRGQGLP